LYPSPRVFVFWENMFAVPLV